MSWDLFSEHAREVRERLRRQGIMIHREGSFISGHYWPDAICLLRCTVKEWLDVLNWDLGPRAPALAELIPRIANASGITEKQVEKMKPEQIVLTAFFFAATAYAVYRLLPTREGSRRDEQGREPSSPPRPAASQPPPPNVLVLAVPASRNENLLGMIERGGELRAEHVEDLLHTTRAIWAGVEATFDGSPLARHFREGWTDRPELDDTDVRLLHLRVAGFPPGFHRGESTLQRIDTLRRLAHNGVRVTVSPRLPISALDGAGMYS